MTRTPWQGSAGGSGSESRLLLPLREQPNDVRYGGRGRKGIIVYREPDLLSGGLNWVPPPPAPQASVFPAKGSRGGETQPLAGDGVLGPESDDWTEPLVLYVV